MKRISLLLILVLLCLAAHAQSLMERHSAQERLVRDAYEKHKVTSEEYYKLLRELDIIKGTLITYNSDGKLTDRETRVINEKLAKAEARLHRYQTNDEVK